MQFVINYFKPNKKNHLLICRWFFLYLLVEITKYLAYPAPLIQLPQDHVNKSN